MTAPLTGEGIRTLAESNLRRLSLKAEADRAELLSAAGHADLAMLLGECQSAFLTLAELLSPAFDHDSTNAE